MGFYRRDTGLLLAFLPLAFAVGKRQGEPGKRQQRRQKRVRIKQPQQLPTALNLTVGSV
ncbi:hypothetical protein [Pseudomonas sp. UBA2684]|uniref:hypothetical protein n=1 Tax=Pseudomonas sp. UBA2684 TaxID=1947311 RepID=UPI0025DC87E3|nr:hypothetical protein [Pseudomonas sp. UBA2684]|tara:strand:- start:4771 stop:4947 length:177 start_codon:yes stop_codon:yes gene_type:complete